MLFIIIILLTKMELWYHFSGHQRLLTDESPRLRNALRYTIYGKSGVFDADRFIDVMQAFENFITAAKSGGGEDLSGRMAELGVLQTQTTYILPGFPSSGPQSEQPIQTRAALAFLLSDKGNFFREFLLDEVMLKSLKMIISLSWTSTLLPVSFPFSIWSLEGLHSLDPVNFTYMFQNLTF